jgi:hypothetical protein
MLMVRVAQLMEDVWTACELDTWWQHPLNLGWIKHVRPLGHRAVIQVLVADPRADVQSRLPKFIEERFPTPPPVAPKEKYLAGVAQVGHVVPFTPSQPGRKHVPAC